MSTRATYEFNAKQPSYRVTFYIHHDGYELGAASYFWAMHHCANRCGGYAAMFLRANTEAEFTGGHETHSDTQYRYTLDGKFLSVRARSSDRWRVIFAGEYHEFINAHSGGIEAFEPLYLVQVGRYYPREHIVTRSQAAESVRAASEALKSYRERFPEATGDIGGLESELNDWSAALADIDARAVTGRVRHER